GADARDLRVHDRIRRDIDLEDPRSERVALGEHLKAVAARHDLVAIEHDRRQGDYRVELSGILRFPRDDDEPYRSDRLEFVVERLGVANHDDRECVTAEHTLRGCAGARATHGGETLPVTLQIVGGKPQESRGRHDRTYLPRLFPS